MGTDPLDSEGRGLGTEPVLGPGLEEMEAAGPGATSLWGQERKKPRSGATTTAETVVPTVSCPPGQGGSGREEGTPTMGDDIEEAEGEEEEGLGPNQRAEEQEPLLGPTVSAAPAPPDWEGPPPSACTEPYPQKVEEKESALAAEEIQEEKEPMVVEEEEEGAAVALGSCCVPMEEPPEESECPICTEPYDQEAHCPAPLNCSHVLCGRCLRAIMEAGSAADIGRVRCPICRQKTPMMEWEICRLQEELLLLGASEGGLAGETPAATAASLLFRPLPPRRPGFWGGLEHRFRVRFLTSRTVGCLPCLRYPPGLVQGLERLEGRCRWGYRVALLALTAADALSLLLVFLPIALLLLLFLIMDQ